MTKEQILAEIAAKIEGQGSAIDAGSALPGILRGILEIAAAGANVQSDYTQADSAKPDYIKNKPALKAVATSGSYDDLTNKPTIPAAQVNADWNATEGVAEILNKPTIPQGALIVEGEDLIDESPIGDVPFTPRSGQSSFQEALLAFRAGRTVLLKINIIERAASVDVEIVTPVVIYDNGISNLQTNTISLQNIGNIYLAWWQS